jgi:glycosyltransferase involved in cell wall biosynthesis
LKIVHLLLTLAPYGVERSVLELVTHLHPERFVSEVWYLSGRGELAPAFTARGIRVRRVPLLFPRDLSIVPRLTFALGQAMARLLHTHHPEATAYGRLAAQKSRLDAVITTEHSVVHWSEPGRFTNKLIRATVGTASRVVSVSRAVEYLSRGAGAALPDRSIIIHDGVSATADGEETADPVARRRAARERFGLPETGPLVATLGRLAPEKGLAQMIEMAPLVLSERADTWFAVAGSGPERARLEKQAREAHVEDRFFFVGAVPDPHEFLPAVDVFLLPSLTEGYGIGGLEAMSHGIPVVATHVGGIPELLENGDGGLMVSANAPREMAAVVLYFLSSALFSAETGGAGRKHVAGPGSAARMAREYADLYEQVIRKGS